MVVDYLQFTFADCRESEAVAQYREANFLTSCGDNAKISVCRFVQIFQKNLDCR